MRIEAFETVEDDRGVRVSASLKWEDSERPDDTLYFESRRLSGPDLVVRPEPFLLGAFPLALWLGERRVRVDGALCPRLREGALLAAQQLIRWHPRLAPLELEAAAGFSPSVPPAARHAAMMLSGGIDSLSLLRRNRLEYPGEHPGHIRTGFFAFGLNSFDFRDGEPVPERRDAVRRYGERLRAFAQPRGVELVDVETNLRALYPDWPAWVAVGWGMGIAATGLAAASGVSDLWIAGNGLGLQVDHWAQCHLAPWVSPAGLDFRVGERVASRLEETRLVSEWRGAGEVASSCFWLEVPPAPRINCGTCEKCVRTMLAIVALDRVSEMPAFPCEALTAALVERTADSAHPDNVPHYRPLPPLLRAVGRDDLADAVEALVQEVSNGDSSPSSSPSSGILGRLTRWPR